MNNSDSFLDYNTRKTTAAYWSDISKAAKAMQHMFKRFYEPGGVELLRSYYFLDPSCGGGALLLAAYYNAVRVDIELTGENHINLSHFIGIELNDSLEFRFEFSRMNEVAHHFAKVPVQGDFVLVNANSFDVDWSTLCPPHLTMIVANPPFTTGKHLSPEQKAILKKFKVKNLDAAFVIYGANQGFYGWWIVNHNITVLNVESLNNACKVIDGSIHYDIVSHGSQPERWIVTLPGKGNLQHLPYSSVPLTDWCKCDSILFSKTGDIDVETYKGIRKMDRYIEVNPDTDYIVACKFYDAVHYKHPKHNKVFACVVIFNPDEWTLSVLDSHIFRLWVNHCSVSRIGERGGQLSVSRQFYTFPLPHGYDLSKFDGLSDDEILDKLISMYINLK